MKRGLVLFVFYCLCTAYVAAQEGERGDTFSVDASAQTGGRLFDREEKSIEHGGTASATAIVETTVQPPTKPGEQEIPKVPSSSYVPSVPERPDTPDVSSKPEIPDVPDVSSKPEIPDVPDVPSKPEIPDVPDVPSKPEIPDVPDVPSKPDVPSFPEFPDFPDFSTVPEYEPDYEPVFPLFPVDFNSTEAALRTHIFEGDVAGASRILRSSRVISLGAGLTYPEELSPLVEPTSQRNRDPDVVAFKALAKSALETHDAFKLATAVTLSFTPDCECSLFSSDELDDLREAFARDFKDRKELVEIIKADANTELTGTGRELKAAGGSPVTSFICSSCWPKKSCKKMYWC